MHKIFEKEFAQTIIDLEVDFSTRGGLQRFRAVGDLQQWFQEEVTFWDWLISGVGSQTFRAIGQPYQQLFISIEEFRNLTMNFTNTFQQRVRQFTEYNLTPRENSQTQIKQLEESFATEIESFKSQIRNNLLTRYLHQPYLLYRGLPEAVFVKQISKTEPATAVYVFWQFIQNEWESTNDSTPFEVKGRLLATLYEKGLIPKKDSQKFSYSESIKTWQTELSHFKKDYEDQLTEFSTTRADIQKELLDLQENAAKLQEEFNAQKDRNENDLSNLKETYETHMQLHGPMTYWKDKRIEHDKAINIWKNWCVLSGISGISILLGCAYLLLPGSSSSGFIPWRQIGEIIMISTIVIWIMRFPFKVLLSHIHLRGDAKEREVMISTYMAMLRGVDGKQGMSKDDLVMVLTPIFRPATSGIIKDDGGPLSVIEMISKAAK